MWDVCGVMCLYNIYIVLTLSYETCWFFFHLIHLYHYLWDVHVWQDLYFWVQFVVNSLIQTEHMRVWISKRVLNPEVCARQSPDTAVVTRIPAIMNPLTPPPQKLAGPRGGTPRRQWRRAPTPPDDQTERVSISTVISVVILHVPLTCTSW